MSPARRTDRDPPGGAARMETQELFAKRIRAWREGEDLTRRELATRVGITEQTLLNWEHGTAPSFHHLRALVKVTGIGGDYWLGLTAFPSRRR